MAGEGYNALVGIEQGGNTLFVKNGGKILLQTGSILEKESGVTETGNKISVNTAINDISSAGSVFVASPVAGNITLAYSAVNGTVTTADEVLTLKIGGTPVTNGVITIANGSGAGDVDSATPTAANTVTKGQAIEVANSGASGAAIRADITIEITQS
jgi:hypothetical protein